MFYVVQSNDFGKLSYQLSQRYAQGERGIFEPFVVIVPAMVLEAWLKKMIARHVNVSTLLTTQFWGQYQWQMIERVLACDNMPLGVPEVAVLSQSVMRLRIFAYLMGGNPPLLLSIGQDKSHALYELLVGVFDEQGHVQTPALWRLCDKLARLYVQYLIERPDWLRQWGVGASLDVPAMIAQKDKFGEYWQADDDKESVQTPAWLGEYYVGLERALAFLWRTLFCDVFAYRETLERHFWHLLDNKTHPNHHIIKKQLPKTLHLFTVQQLPQIELDFLKRLSLHIDVVLLHFNPSAMFWADIVDKNWLLTQRLIHPKAVALKDYGHALLSRLGKSARETFAMISDMAGGGDETFPIVWQDDFEEFEQGDLTALSVLKKDILMLTQHEEVDYLEPVVIKACDDSLRVYNCHNIKRELEMARLAIGRWLNVPNDDGTARKLSDVAIMMPDVEQHRELLDVLFLSGEGLDGLTLPARLTGVSDVLVSRLWRAMMGFYTLTASRFYYREFCEWLLLPELHQSFGMTLEMAMQACELLKRAGFVRGFDEWHLRQSLDDSDQDYRRTFAYALDRLVVSLMMADGLSDVLHPFEWQAQSPQKTATVLGIGLDDATTIWALCRLHQALDAQRGQYEKTATVNEWLDFLEYQLINPYFALHKTSETMNSIFGAMNAMRTSVRANQYYTKLGAGRVELSLRLPLKFVLDMLASAIEGQKIAAEAHDVISIGRFGSLRGIRFGLVVMVGMNLSEFPRTDPLNRLDLTKAGLPRRGDRVSEDDDNGAFLEALFQARHNCWIFYSGQTADGKEVLPASPVGELIQFVKNSTWQVYDDDPKLCKNAHDMPHKIPLETWLIKKYPALPFQDGVFVVREATNVDVNLPPPPLWRSVFEVSKETEQKSNKTTALTATLAQPADIDKIGRCLAFDLNPCDEQVFGAMGWTNDNLALVALPTQISADGLAVSLARPNRVYLAGRRHRAFLEETVMDEPLSLSGLEQSLLRKTMMADVLQGNAKAERVLYEPALPAGISKTTTLDKLGHDVRVLLEIFREQVRPFGIDAPSPSHLQMHTITLVLPAIGSHTLRLSARLPSAKTAVWGNLSTDSLTDIRRVSCFVHHVFWQLTKERVAKPTNPYDGVSVWQFWTTDKGECLAFLPMTKEVAMAVVGRWLMFVEFAKQFALPLPAKVAFAELEGGDDGIAPKQETVACWQYRAFGSDYLPDSSSFHEDWRLILGQHDPIAALCQALPLVPFLYQDLMTYTLKFETLGLD